MPIAGITDGEENVFAWCHGAMLGVKISSSSNGSGFKDELSTARHGIARVHGQVQNNLVELTGSISTMADLERGATMISTSSPISGRE